MVTIIGTPRNINVILLHIKINQPKLADIWGGAEIASIRKHKHGKPKYKTGRFTSMENASIWNTQVRTYMDGIRKYGNRKYESHISTE